MLYCLALLFSCVAAGLTGPVVQTDQRLVESDQRLMENDQRLVETDQRLVENDQRLVETDQRLVETTPPGLLQGALGAVLPSRSVVSMKDVISDQ